MPGAAGAVLRAAGYPLVAAMTRVLFDLEIEGARFVPREGAALLVCNHQGYLDPLFLQISTSRTVHYLMTSDFYDLPAARPLFRLLDAIRVPAGGLPKDALEGALEVLRSGGLVGVFPEGRLSRDGTIGRIRPGAAFLAARSGVPVVPARIRGSIRVLPKGCWLPRQAGVRIRMGPPRTLSPSRREAAREIREAWEHL
jgi:1-acyl-sn-glycerol-3-phosphate acyltransferase